MFLCERVRNPSLVDLVEQMNRKTGTSAITFFIFFFYYYLFSSCILHNFSLCVAVDIAMVFFYACCSFLMFFFIIHVCNFRFILIITFCACNSNNDTKIGQIFSLQGTLF